MLFGRIVLVWVLIKFTKLNDVILLKVQDFSFSLIVLAIFGNLAIIQDDLKLLLIFLFLITKAKRKTKKKTKFTSSFGFIELLYF